jgi:hypothetical protein
MTEGMTPDTWRELLTDAGLDSIVSAHMRREYLGDEESYREYARYFPLCDDPRR